MNIPKVYHASYFKTLVIYVGIFCIFTAIFSAYFYISVPRCAEICPLQISFLDVGQGDGTLIKTSSGVSVLIDSGPLSGPFFESLSKKIHPLDSHIDVVLASHPDADHIGGFPKLMEKFSFGLYIDSFVRSGTSLHQRVDVMVNKKNNLRAYAGMTIKISNSKSDLQKAGTGTVTGTSAGMSAGAEITELKILFPDFEYTAQKIEACLKRKEIKKKTNCTKAFEFETNEQSIVARLVHGSSSVMLTGDAPKEVERFILDQWNVAYQNGHRADRSTRTSILKAGHHGSKTSTDPEFVKWLKPEFAIVSAGKDNRYGHPHKSVVDTLKEERVQIFVTSEFGTIDFYSKENGFYR